MKIFIVAGILSGVIIGLLVSFVFWVLSERLKDKIFRLK